MARFTVQEAAEHANVSASLIYLWCAERRLPHIRLGQTGKRGKVLIDEEDLKRFLETARLANTHCSASGRAQVLTPL